MVQFTQKSAQIQSNLKINTKEFVFGMNKLQKEERIKVKG